MFFFFFFFFNGQECFIGFKTTRHRRVVLDPIRHMLSFLNWLEKKKYIYTFISGKACVNRYIYIYIYIYIEKRVSTEFINKYRQFGINKHS